MRKILPSLLALVALSLAGCYDYGTVIQGRTVAYDATSKTVTVLEDKNTEEKKDPNYVLPVVVFAMPTDPAEMGQAPTAGLRVNLDTDKKIITMYNPATKTLDNIPFELVTNDVGVDVAKQHASVYDATTKKPRVFPVVDKENRTITIYSRRQLKLTTIKLSEANFARFGEKDWDAGEEVRIYYKEMGKALRFMNIPKTK